MKRGFGLFLLLLILVGFSSAGFLDSFFDGFTGKVVGDSSCIGEAVYQSPLGLSECSSTFPNSAYSCKDINDGDKASWWLASVYEDSNPEVILDLNEEKCVSGLDFLYRPINNKYKIFLDVYVSNDKVSWEKVFGGWEFSNGLDNAQKTFSEKNARYVKIVYVSTNANIVKNLAEVKVLTREVSTENLGGNVQNNESPGQVTEPIIPNVGEDVDLSVDRLDFSRKGVIGSNYSLGDVVFYEIIISNKGESYGEFNQHIYITYPSGIKYYMGPTIVGSLSPGQITTYGKYIVLDKLGYYEFEIYLSNKSFDKDFNNNLLKKTIFVGSNEPVSECSSGQTRSCGINLGVCQQGVNNCIDGFFSNECVGAINPSEEICLNNLDDDCDGQIDNGCEVVPDSCPEGYLLVEGVCKEQVLEFCGDGIRNGDEECDDLNSNNLDSCSNLCVINFCGDGVKNNGEICDDGGNNGKEGSCNEQCSGVVPLSCSLTFARWLVDSSVEGQSVGLEVLGENCNGKEIKIQVYEDDGILGKDFVSGNPSNIVISNGKANANWISEWQCDGEVLGVCTFGTPEYKFVVSLVEDSSIEKISSNELIVNELSPTCGNGLVQEGEGCDDGNNVDNDACSNVCTINFCGDGVVNNGEICDGGQRQCILGGYVGSESCNPFCNGFNECTTSLYCGDGLVNGNEFCDDGSLNGQGGKCSLNCLDKSVPVVGDFVLEYIDSTALGIVINWNYSEESSKYFVERSESSDFSNFVTYEMDSKVPVYMDVGRDENYPTISRFFNARSDPNYANSYYLDPKKSYYYRIKKIDSFGNFEYSNIIGPHKIHDYKNLEEIPRGIEGDLRADVVLGKSDFSQNVWFKTDDLNLRYPGGIIFDEGTSRPTHSYVIDGSNNRILGYEHLGYCAPGIKENYALGKTYTKSIEPVQYLDEGNREFTDGSFKVDNQISFAYLVPQNGNFGEVDVDIDLGSLRKVNVISLQVLERINSFEAYVSKDNVTFEFVGSNEGEINWNREMKIIFPERDARYIRFKAKSNIFVPGQTSWMYLAEGKVGHLSPDAISDINNKQKCSLDSDCSGDSVCEMSPGEIKPKVILGQPDSYSNSCNGDGSIQTWPNRLSARADSLCFTKPFAFSVGEGTTQLNLAIDNDHNLYIPDIENHRVLKFEDPFNNDNVADGVIGQDNFSGNECYKGAAYPSEDTLCFPKAVGIDSSGKLYVLDAGERSSRILRYDIRNGNFPKIPELDSGDRFFHPDSIYFDDSDNLYVGKENGLLKLNGPIGNSFPNSITLLDERSRNFEFYRGSAIAVDPTNPNHVWVQGKGQFQQLYDLSQNKVVKKLQSGQFRGLEFSPDGDLYWINAHEGIYKLEKEYLSQLKDNEPIFGELALKGNTRYPSEGTPSIDSTHSIDSINSVGDQLLVIDAWGSRVLYWNDKNNLENGKSADGVWGYKGKEDDWGYQNPRYRDIEVDSKNRVWIFSYSEQKVYVLQGPIGKDSIPLKVIDFRNLKYRDSRGRLVEFSSSSKPSLSLSFDVVDNGDTIWFTDDFPKSRVLRVVNVLGEKNSGEEPYVDIILGQENARDTQCNKGRSASDHLNNRAWGRDTLCSVQTIDVDSYGNVYVKENANGGHDGGFTRYLMYSNTSIPKGPIGTVYNILPEKVYSNSDEGEFSEINCQGIEVCNPLAPLVYGANIMVFGNANSGHLGTSFTAVNLDRNNDIHPQFVLADYNGFAGATHIDKDMNLYVGDRNYHRVLVYKNPFKKFLD